jgi:BirA family biotin operon repressor/biotin-[acetyl-CoA-carboxylase] ligase
MITIHQNECKSSQLQLIDYCSDIKEFEPILISVEKQTEGIGRSNNTWHHFDNSFACSFTLKANEVLTLSSLEIGVLIHKFLLNKFNVKTTLKWPNDIFYQDKKLGGIIIYNNSNFLICGVGLNFKANEESDFEYSSLDLNADEELYKEFYNFVLVNRLSSNEVKEQWSDLCFHLDKNVSIDNSRIGIFKGVGDNGQALIEIDSIIIEEYSATLRVIDHP